MFAARVKTLGVSKWASVIGIFYGLTAVSATYADLYQASEDITKFGYLNQYNVDPGWGHVACAPTAATNGFVFLQNTYPGTYDSAIAGSLYSSWTQTAWILGDMDAKSPHGKDMYMHTERNNGTLWADIISGTELYLNDRAGVGANLYAASYLPTGDFLFNALSANRAIELGIIYDTGGGHAMTLTSLSWNDLDGDHNIDMNEGLNPGENAQIGFVDPLDPLNISGNIAKQTIGEIWSTADGKIHLRYLQGSIWTDSYINLAMTVWAGSTPVPAPGAALLLMIGLGLVHTFKKRLA